MKKKVENDYSKYYYKPQKNTSRKKVRAKFSVVFFMALLVLVVGFFSYAFSNFLTIGKIVNINTNFISSGKTIYAISLETENSLEEATKKAQEYKLKGGAGYVFKDGTLNYKILSSAYSSKKDAQSVSNNLIESGISAEIVELNFLPINLKISLNSKESETLKKGINLFYSNYLSLYELGNKFDQNKLDEVSVKKEINYMISDNSDVIEEISKTFSTSNNIAVLYSKIYLGQINKTLNKLLTTENLLSSEIKNSYFEIIFQYLSLQDEIM